jgi:hypothetical protein
MWSGFKYAFPNEHEYTADLSPLPVERAFASSFAGISIRSILELASGLDMKNLRNLSELNPWKLMALKAKVIEKHGQEKADIILSEEVDKNIPPVLLLDTFQQEEAADYVELEKCHSKLLYGIPHIVFGHYTFARGGRILPHAHRGGVEFLYSQKGTFELTCAKETYPILLSDMGSVYVYDSQKEHSVVLKDNQPGRLLMIRYYPRKRFPRPGRKLRDRSKPVKGVLIV